MFIGHYGPAVWDTQRGKGTPIVTLWQGFLAVQAMDIVFAFLTMFGLEYAIPQDANNVPVLHIPWSHSLLSAIVIAILAAGVFRLLKPSASGKAMLVIAALAFSHWPLDLLVHRPDLPPYPGSSALMGFGLWDYAWATYALEVGLLGTAIAWWLKVTKGPLWTTLGAWLIVTLLSVMQFFVMTKPTLDAQAGVLVNPELPGPVAQGVSFLVVFGVIAGAIWLVERKREARV